MMDSLDEVNNLLNGKFAIKYAGASIEAMREISQAYKKRKL
jgi:hypothetical protein